ncbi:MAG: hypothetical protein ACYDAQ_07095 [Mycobacteriales bacterium]
MDEPHTPARAGAAGPAVVAGLISRPRSTYAEVSCQAGAILMTGSNSRVGLRTGADPGSTGW